MSDTLDSTGSAETQRLRAENAILRFAFGIRDNERVPLDQKLHFGSISVDSGSARRRIEPINDDVIRLERELTELRAENERLKSG